MLFDSFGLDFLFSMYKCSEVEICCYNIRRSLLEKITGWYPTKSAYIHTYSDKGELSQIYIERANKCFTTASFMTSMENGGARVNIPIAGRLKLIPMTKLNLKHLLQSLLKEEKAKRRLLRRKEAFIPPLEEYASVLQIACNVVDCLEVEPVK